MNVDEAFFKEAADGIYICATQVSVPLHFCIHTYIVTVLHGESNRYEVYREYGTERPDGHVYKNLMWPWVGNHVFAKTTGNAPGKRFGVQVLQSYTDEVEILELIHKIDRIYLEYPDKHRYNYFAPNSNSFTQWLLGELGLIYKLPLTAWGGRYYR